MTTLAWPDNEFARFAEAIYLGNPQVGRVRGEPRPFASLSPMERERFRKQAISALTYLRKIVPREALPAILDILAGAAAVPELEE